MLEPSARTLFLDALSPPVGMTLDWAIGTTFTLDLQALLSVPLALTFANTESAEGDLVRDPVALLEALRRHANRVSIYCQTGAIAIPRTDNRLHAYLEGCVVEVRAPRDRALFHPKVWVLRFVAPGAVTRYRVLVASRNLTFDRSWDAVLCLEGIAGGRTAEDPDPGPLADFVAALPGLAIRPAEADHLAAAAALAVDLRSVRFELPPGVDRLAFLPLGLPGRGRIRFEDRRIDRLLIVSPFVGTDFLLKTAPKSGSHMLVTRSEEALHLSAACADRYKLWALAENATPSDEPSPANGEAAGSLVGLTELTGLHAKLYVADAGWRARAWMGSANATRAGHEINVEMMVELEGPKGQIGIDAFLGDGQRPGFLSLLQPLPPDICEDRPRDDDEADHVLDVQLRALAGVGFVLKAGELGDDRHAMTLSATREIPKALAGAHLTATARLCSQGGGSGVSMPLHGTPAIELVPVSFEGLTSFVVLELQDAFGRTVSCSINTTLLGAPADRQERLLRAILATPNDVQRYLLLLLAGTDSPLARLAKATHSVGSTAALGDDRLGLPTLFEGLLITLRRSPADLRRVSALVEDLRKTPEGTALLPHDFAAAWEPIWKVAQETLR